MLYCNHCAANRGYPMKEEQTRRKCDICRTVTSCNNVKSSDLPAPPPFGKLGPNDRRTASRSCVHCDRPLNAVGPLNKDDPAPREGGITVCTFCGAVMKLAHDLTPRCFTPDEAEALLANKEWMDYLSKVVLGVHIMQTKLNKNRNEN